MSDNSNEGGRPRTAHDNKWVLVVAKHGPLTSKEAAERLGVSRRTATRRLSELHKAGRVHRKDAGTAAMWATTETPTLDEEER